MDLSEPVILSSLLISGILFISWFHSLINLWKSEVYKERLLLVKSLVETSLNKMKLADYYAVTITLPPDITCLINSTYLVITNGYYDVIIHIPCGIMVSYYNGTLFLRVTST